MQRLFQNLLIALVLLLPAQLVGEGFAISSLVDTKFEGGLGSFVGFASRITGHDLRNVVTETDLQGHQLRINSNLTTTIYDLDAERVINIDEKQKTYSSMTFAEMNAAYERARAAAAQSRAKDEAKALKKDEAKASKKDEVKMKYHVTVDRPGQHAMVAGYDAERVFITITIEAEAAPEGGKTEQVGGMVLLLDQWIAPNPPHGQALAEFYRLFSQKLGREFRSQAQGMQALFASDPRLKDGFEAAGKELQKVKGISLHSTTYAVLVPANLVFNRQLVLDGAAKSAANKSDEPEKNAKEKSKVGGFFGALKSAAVDAGKRMENANQGENAPPKQSTLLVIDDQLTGIRAGALPASMFAPPDGYREVKSKGL